MKILCFVSGQKGVFARSVQAIADEIELPSWLVDLRHDATHSSLPSLAMLETGVNVALHWLKENYWDKTYDAVFNNTEENIRKVLASNLHLYVDLYISSDNMMKKKKQGKSPRQEIFQPAFNSMKPLLNAINVR